jgi:hypothetical protein
MTVRKIALALTSVAAFGVVPAATAHAHAASDSWRFVAQYASLSACQSTGRGFVARRTASEYKCENDYTQGGAPVLDLYVR